MELLHIDIETYSSENIKKTGSYKYMESLDFEILMVAYAFNDEKVQIIDLAQGEKLPTRFIDALSDEKIIKMAHNANFERNAFRTIGYDIPTEQWFCTMIHSAYCGLPLGLGDISVVLGLSEDKAKMSSGKALIKYFCEPCKPTKTNGKRSRNMWYHNKQSWNEFKRYCINDVEAEREIENQLINYPIPEWEMLNYRLDQKINDTGLLVDLDFANIAISFDNRYKNGLIQRAKEITGVDNPNSASQLKKWLEKATGKEIKSLAKDKIQPIIDEVEDASVLEVLDIRKKLSKTSTKKYPAMFNCACYDHRVRGLFQFQGGNRTGRWAGRLVQLQNLPRNYIEPIETAREIVASGDYEMSEIMYGNMSNLLSQLIRTSFIASEGYTFGVADFSAIEARVIAWLANETWRLDVFSTHGKIYEASASMMFNVPIENITKGSELRNKGKIAELALGYQGSVGALERMGGASMGLTKDEMKSIVDKWRRTNKAVVRFWKNCEACATKAIRTRQPVWDRYKRLLFDCDGQVMTIQLPSGRKLHYQEPSFYINKFGMEAIQYKGMVQETRKWDWIGTYGGKLVENIVQAVARDVLADSMQRLDSAGFKLVMHVHDEAIAEIPKNKDEAKLSEMCEIMGTEIPWAKGLPLDADGYITDFYKKD